MKQKSNKGKRSIRILTAALILTMTAWLMPANVQTASAATYPTNPRTAVDGKVTWDRVYLGHYPQTSDGSGGYNNDRIKWRVLSVNGSDAFLIADKNLDAKKYNITNTAVTWKTSTVRSWLNGYDSSANTYGEDYSSDNFIKKAFTSAEQKGIKDTTLVNDDNSEYGTEGGNNTTDKVFFLSISEATNASYGFTSTYERTPTREAKNTYYAKKTQWCKYGYIISMCRERLLVAAVAG